MKHFRAFTTFSTSGAMENRHFISPKTPETPPPLYRSNTTAFANVPTPTSDHHLVHVC
jgi:hypothetical protein